MADRFDGMLQRTFPEELAPGFIGDATPAGRFPEDWTEQQHSDYADLLERTRQHARGHIVGVTIVEPASEVIDDKGEK